MSDKYIKPAKTFSEQADILISRGLLANKSGLEDMLQHVNYYRIGCYSFFFKTNGSDDFLPDTTFETVWERYTFDRRLRLILLDAIERVEISVRAQFSYFIGSQFGCFGLYDARNFPNYNRHSDGIDDLTSLAKNSREEFMIKHRQKYQSDIQVPIWIAVELMSFGAISHFIAGLDRYSKGKQLAAFYGVNFWVLSSWLKSVCYLRNICAHHARVWQRQIAISPICPNKDCNWISPVDIAYHNRKLFTLLTILRYLMQRIAPQSSWEKRFLELLQDYPTIPLSDLGFPANFADSPLWANSPLLKITSSSTAEVKK